MDPVSSIANALGSIFGPDSIFGAGRRAEFENLPDWITPDQVRPPTDYTPYLVLIGGILLLIVLILVILKSK